MFQVLVRTTAVMQGAYTYLLGSRAEADEFVQRPDVWWYHYPAEHEDWDWRRGGAWTAAAMLSGVSGDLSSVAPQEPAEPGPSWWNKELDDAYARQREATGEDDEDDDRW
jgi:hypothetical protein